MANKSNDDATLNKKREALKEKLAAKEAEMPSSTGQNKKKVSGKADGYRLITDFIASIIVGVGLGLIFDEFAGTSPLGLLVFLLLGFASGMMKLIKAGQKAQQAQISLRSDYDDDGK